MPEGIREKSRSRKIAAYCVKLAIGVAIVAVLFAKLDMHKVAQAMLQLDAVSLFWVWFWTALGLWLHSQMLTSAFKPFGMVFRTVDVFKIGFEIRFYALFMPGASNLLIKWHKLAKPSGKPGQTLAVMAYTRIIHVFAMLVLSVLGMIMDSRFPWRSVRDISLLFLVGICACIFLASSRRFGSYLDALVELALGHFDKWAWFQEKCRKIWSFFTYFRNLTPRQIVILLVLTTVGQFFMTVGQQVISHAVGMEISVWTQLWIRGVVLISAIVPISFSGLGIREVSIVKLMQFYGVPDEIALAWSLAFFGLTIGIGIVGGILEGYEHFFGGAQTIVKTDIEEGKR